jgi:hypothetical protein
MQFPEPDPREIEMSGASELEVAGDEMVACVGLCTDTMVAPGGMPAPVIGRPTSAAVKLMYGEVTVVDPLVTVPLKKLVGRLGHGVFALSAVGPASTVLVTEPVGPVDPVELTVVVPARTKTAGPKLRLREGTVMVPPGGRVTSGVGAWCCGPPKSVRSPATPKA